MTFRTIIWAAVSTPDQATDEKESIPAQIEAARKTIQERGWYEVAEPLVVPGRSRYINWLDQAMTEIPQLKALIELAEAGKIDVVVVRDWDRLARTDSLRVQISTRLREQGVQVFSLNQPVEPSEPPGKVTDTALIVEGMTGILAEIENRLRARRWAMGMLGRIKRGSWPWTNPPYGYVRESGDEILAIDPEAAETVRTIYRLSLEGKGVRAIARHLNQTGRKPKRSDLWVGSTLGRLLRNPTYLGLIPFRSQTYPGKHEPIIDERTWNQVQALLDRRRNFGGRAVGSDRLLIGLLRCGHCGRKMGSRKMGKKGERIYYRCRRYLESGRSACRPNHHSERKLMDALMSLIAGHAEDDELLSMMLAQQERRGKAELAQEREAILDSLSQMGDRRRRQWLAYEKGKINLEEFADSRILLKDEEEALGAALDSVEAALTRTVTKDTLKDTLARLSHSWQAMERSQLKAALAALIDMIGVYDDGRMEITYA